MKQQNGLMDYTMEYMERLFFHIKHKKTESYVIHRIWDKLDDPRIEFVTQQRILLPDGKYALADLFLPQLNVFVEINEPFHADNREEDYRRNVAIVQQTHFHQRIIECGYENGGWRTLQDIHQQIDDCVTFIKYQIATKGQIVSSGEKLTVGYLKRKRILRTEDNDALRTIDDICELTGAIAQHRGYRRAGAAAFPSREDMIVWFPNLTSRDWNNVLAEDGDIIYESPKDIGRCEEHATNLLAKHAQRLTFALEKNAIGMTAYYFKGVYELDEDATRESLGASDGAKVVWRRRSREYELEPLNNKTQRK